MSKNVCHQFVDRGGMFCSDCNRAQIDHLTTSERMDLTTPARRIVLLRFIGPGPPIKADNSTRIRIGTEEERIAGSAGYLTTYIVETLDGKRKSRVPGWMCIAEYGE